MPVNDREGNGASWPPGVAAELGTGASALPSAVGLCDRNGRLLRAGGWDDLPSWAALGVPEEVSRVIRRGCGAVLGTGQPATEEVRVESPPGGPVRVLECVFAPLPSEGAESDRVAVIVRDVTRERRAEEALRESERRFRLIAENATDSITRHAPDGTYLYVSPASKAVTGYLPEELLGRSPYEFIHPDDLAAVHQAHSRMLGLDEPHTVSLRAARPDGSFVWLETTAKAIRDPTTNVVLEIQCATRDITPRKQAEQELREQRELLQAMLDNWPSPVYLKDILGRYLLVNRPFETLFGIATGEAIGRTDADLFSKAQAQALRAADRAAVLEGRPIEQEEVIHSADHEAAPTVLLVQRFPLAEPDGQAFAVCAISTDITARRQAEGALREKSVILRSVLDNMADGVIMADERERFLEFNPAAEKMFGLGATETTSMDWSERYGLFLPDTVTPFPADQLPLTRAVRGESINHVEMFVRHARNPEGAWVLINGRPLTGPDGRPAGGVVVCREITERKLAEVLLREQNEKLREAAADERKAHEALKQAEVQLVQAEKLAALGQMVAGFAHEVNNPLAFVSNDMAVLQRDLTALRQLIELYRDIDSTLEAHAPEQLDKVRALAESMDLDYTIPNIDRLTARSREGLRRIQQIVKDLRDFARPDEGDLKAVDLNTGVASTVNLILGKARRLGVELVTEPSPLPPITCYPGKINQVVLNLVMNAVDACAVGKGRVTVRTEALPGGEGAAIHVIDRGSGIAPEVRDRIFDPFFTTKPIGQGTGLGLSISYGIVKAHGGTITVESEPGVGSTFTVRLPSTPPAQAS